MQRTTVPIMGLLVEGMRGKFVVQSFSPPANGAVHVRARWSNADPLQADDAQRSRNEALVRTLFDKVADYITAHIAGLFPGSKSNNSCMTVNVDCHRHH